MPPVGAVIASTRIRHCIAECRVQKPWLGIRNTKKRDAKIRGCGHGGQGEGGGGGGGLVMVSIMMVAVLETIVVVVDMTQKEHRESL